MPAAKLRIRLPVLFLLVTLIACGIALFNYGWRTPLRTGTIYAATCTAQDWETISQAFPGAMHGKRGDLTTWTSNVGHPQELFKTFATRPELWGYIEVANASIADGMLSLGGGSMFNWSASRPVEGWPNGFDSSDLAYYKIQVIGSFLATRWPPRYWVDCVARVTIESGEYREQLDDRSYHLVYTGCEDLIVFSAPLDGELVRLIIIDLR